MDVDETQKIDDASLIDQIKSSNKAAAALASNGNGNGEVAHVIINFS